MGNRKYSNQRYTLEFTAKWNDFGYASYTIWKMDEQLGPQTIKDYCEKYNEDYLKVINSLSLKHVEKLIERTRLDLSEQEVYDYGIEDLFKESFNRTFLIPGSRGCLNEYVELSLIWDENGKCKFIWFPNYDLDEIIHKHIRKKTLFQKIFN